MLTHRRNVTREERETMIVTVFAIDIQHRDHRWLTSNQICNRMNIARSGKFNKLLQEMVLDGRLICREQPNPKHWPGYEYKLAPGMYQEPSHRTVKLSIKGQVWEEAFE